ncbi:signal peptidase II [Helicobacter sp. MIT 21-1697]|uniref:signal peptidase II n=1 Tax=Helicobacter sp. MIT 21-1697 TaxID=2993733 RepID=UPI00224B75A6|nr:signal peptidase II [Helicobacter sp. MIT 21-1697]MCX2716671.1 signal peptidase II [Helicobacter sp. MIT 21-1697]
MRNIFSFTHLRQITTRQMCIFIALFALSILLDQWVKLIMLEGFVWENEAITIGGRALVYNKGVAFSMFSFLEEYLKYIQILFLFLLLLGALWSDFFVKHYVPLGILIGAGLSNIIDRFMYGGVVDYVYWHYWFDFAIFNLADVLIDISVALMILQMLREKKL